MINWHRLFGLTLADYFTNTAYQVEMEKDLARKRQLLDIVIIRSAGVGPPLVDPCDGLESLRQHNLVTYKSGQEALDAWALEELMGHYVNYRKNFAPKEPASAFGLYGVATRRPESLMGEVDLHLVKAGVYTLRALSQPMTIIVLKEVEIAARNALWELFSFEADKVAQGARDYQWRQADHVPILQELYYRYRQWGIAMPYTFEDFRRDLAKELLKELPPEERLRGLPPEERLRGLPPEERLCGLSEEELVRMQSLLESTRKH